jgi:hypothetical protein
VAESGGGEHRDLAFAHRQLGRLSSVDARRAGACAPSQRRSHLIARALAVRAVPAHPSAPRYN